MSDLDDDTAGDDAADEFDVIASWLRSSLFSRLHEGISLGACRSESREVMRKTFRDMAKDAQDDEIERLVTLHRHNLAKRRLRYRALRPPRLDDKAGRITFAHSHEYDEWFARFVRDLGDFQRAEVAAGLSGRRGIAAALEIALEIVNRVPSRHDLTAIAEPLGVLLDALGALDKGHVHPLLAPKHRDRGRKSSPREVELRIRSVLASKALIEMGVSPGEADCRIAEVATPAARIILGDRPHYQFTAKTVRGWREKFQALVRKHDFSNLDFADPVEAWAEDAFQTAKHRGEMEEHAEVLITSLAPENIDLPLNKVGARVRRGSPP